MLPTTTAPHPATHPHFHGLGIQFRSRSAPGWTYMRSVNQRGAVFTRDFEEVDFWGGGGGGGQEMRQPEEPRAVRIRRAERNVGAPVV